jgi:hypothetical protein
LAKKRGTFNFFNPGCVYCKTGRTLAFWAKANASRYVNVNAIKTHNPYQRMWSTDITLTDAWQQYSFTFAPTQSDDNARITFSDLGAATGTCWFAQPSLKSGGVLGLQAGETLDTIAFFKQSNISENI